MNLKYLVLMALAIVFFSCKRTIVSIDKEVKMFRHPSENVISTGPSASGQVCLGMPEYIVRTKEAHRNNAEVVVKRKIMEDSAATKDTSRKQLKRIMKAEQKAKKEVDPRYSRGLLMTIFGGIATTLGIVFMGYAPTGLFVFAFGIVFLVGIVTLIMYWANPKPKM